MSSRLWVRMAGHLAEIVDVARVRVTRNVAMAQGLQASCGHSVSYKVSNRVSSRNHAMVDQAEAARAVAEVLSSRPS